MLKIGSHIGMSGKEMFLGSAKEAVAFGETAFMIYTGAPQNTRRKAIEELNIQAGWEYLHAHGIQDLIIHAPYIINLANSVKPETYTLAVEFLEKELERTKAMGSSVLVLHPGSHVGEGVDAGLKKIIQGLNSVMTKDMGVYIALETMAGKGSEIGRNFQELREILDRVELQDKMGICLDTCHIYDGGYDIVNDLDGVLKEFDQVIGLSRLKAVHLNDSMYGLNSHKDRHAKIGEGKIGKEAMIRIINHPALKDLPFYLETPNDLEGYGAEIAFLRSVRQES